MSKTPDIYERLSKALGTGCYVCVSGACVCCVVSALLVAAPSIYENVDIKKGILLQLFGGTKKSFDETGRGKFRWA